MIVVMIMEIIMFIILYCIMFIILYCIVFILSKFNNVLIQYFHICCLFVSNIDIKCCINYYFSLYSVCVHRYYGIFQVFSVHSVFVYKYS